MLEKDINGIIRKSFSEQGDYSFKIPDSGSYIDGFVTHGKSPFDGFAFYKGRFIAFESKYLSSPSAFNLQRIEDHQIDALKKTKQCLDNGIALITLGVKWSPRETRIYAFSNIEEIEERRNNKNNILKKELEKLDNYVIVKKGIINIEELFKKIGIII